MPTRTRQLLPPHAWIWAAFAALPAAAWVYRYGGLGPQSLPPVAEAAAPAATWSPAAIGPGGLRAIDPRLLPSHEGAIVPDAALAAPTRVEPQTTAAPEPVPESSPQIAEAPAAPVVMELPQLPAAEILATEVAQRLADEASPPIAEQVDVSQRTVPSSATGDSPTAAAKEDEVDGFIDDPSAAALTGAMTGQKIDAEARREITAAYALAERGAYYAAEKKFVAVLRMIADAKDGLTGTTRRGAALAAGLTALEEAAEFLALPADADAAEEATILVRSHKTAVGRASEAAGLAPAQLADRYLRYAQVKLAAAVAGEPAGSMALHALGKIASRTPMPGEKPAHDAVRRAVAFQHAALLARGDNYLAAHELGVLLAETGHYPEASELLRQVADQKPDPTVLRNLAEVERELGNVALANRAEQHALRLAQILPDPRVSWVSPQQFVQQGETPMGPAMAGAPAARPMMVGPAPQGVPPRGPYGPQVQTAVRPSGPMPGRPAPSNSFMR